MAKLVYFACVDSESIQFLESNLPEEFSKKIISTDEEFLEFAEDESSHGECHGIFCGNQAKEVVPSELGQTFHMIFPEAKLFYIAASNESYVRDEMLKNGFDDAFILPIDSSHAKEEIQKLRISLGEKVESYRSVKLFDLGPEDRIDFDLYLHMPANDKYVKYVGSGGTISDDQYKRLQDHGVASGHVQLEDMPKFYKYAASRLQSLTEKSDSISETERQDRVNVAVRTIFSKIFEDSSSSTGQGKALVEEAQEIVKNYVDASPLKGIHERVTSQISNSDNNYSHATNVSVYASLFAIVTDLAKPEDLSIAGLLHDLGETKLPEELLQKDIEEMNSEEKAAYIEHPANSLKIAKQKNLVIPDAARRAILQHHERADGSGFPKGQKGSVISIEAQILGFADEFDELTQSKPGRKTLTPGEVIEKFKDGAKFSTEVVHPLIPIFS